MLETIIGDGNSGLEVKFGIVKIVYILIITYFTNFKIIFSIFSLLLYKHLFKTNFLIFLSFSNLR